MSDQTTPKAVSYEKRKERRIVIKKVEQMVFGGFN